jgi:hypothetical protein
MIEKRQARLMLLACLVGASVGLLTLPTAAPAKAKKATLNQCVSAAVAIPDGPPPNSAATNPAASFAVHVKVPRFKGKQQNGRITAFNSAGVRISHTDDGDLSLFLVSPGGRAVSLSTFRDQSTNLDEEGHPSPSGDGYGSGTPSCAGSLVQFGDTFPTPITTPGNLAPDAPITGSFAAEQPLRTFVGGPAGGFWTLIAQDVQFQDVGQINALSLSFTYSYKAKGKKRR